MDTSKTTPGPWTVTPSGTTVWADFPHDDPNTGFRCSVGREIAKVTRDDATDIANAALIAKAPIAPKLAEALREARKTLYTAIDLNVDLEGFDPAEHVVIKWIDEVLAEWDAQ